MTIPQCIDADREYYKMPRCKICDKPLDRRNTSGVCSNCQSRYKDWRSKIKEKEMTLNILNKEVIRN